MSAGHYSNNTIGLQVLTVLAASSLPLTRREVEAHLDESETVGHRIYKTLWNLKQRGYVLQTCERGVGIDAQYCITQAGLDAIAVHVGTAVMVHEQSADHVAELLDGGYINGRFTHLLSSVKFSGVDVPPGVPASVFDLAKVAA